MRELREEEALYSLHWNQKGESEGLRFTSFQKRERKALKSITLPGQVLAACS